MVAVSINIDITGALKDLDNIAEKQVPFATSKTLNALAFESAKKALPKEADKVFDGGATPWTKRGFKFIKSTKKHLVAVVYIDNETHEYLSYQVEGGTRTPKAKKILVPTSHIKKNKFGNITKAKRAALFTNKKKYFRGAPKGGATLGLGIWERYGRNNKIRKVASFVDKATYNNKKLDVKRVVIGRVNSRAQVLFLEHLRRALATAR